MIKRRAFSILEVLIAIGILAFLGAALVINFYKSHQERKEKDTIDLIQSKLRMAAQLAKISDSEVQVLFTEVDGKFAVSFDSDLKVSDRLKPYFTKKSELTNIEEIVVSGSREENLLSYFPWGMEEEEVEVAVTFRSGNEHMIDPTEYAPNILIEDPAAVEDIFPQEIVDDEKEEKQIHTD